MSRPRVPRAPLSKSLADTGLSHLAQIVQTFPQLDVWGARLREEQGDPATGSEMEADRAAFPHLSVDDLVWQGLAAANDHMKGFRLWLNNRELFPIATFSLLRGALVGAAVASYIVIPDQHGERVGRALAVANEWYRNHLNWAKNAGYRAVDSADHAAVIAHVERRRQQVIDLQGTYPHAPFKLTVAIEAVANSLWPDDQEMRDDLMSVWRAGSGDAHALGWSILSRSYAMTPDPSGKATFVGSPSNNDIAAAYLPAYDLTAYAFDRFDYLSQRYDYSPGADSQQRK